MTVDPLVEAGADRSVTRVGEQGELGVGRRVSEDDSVGESLFCRLEGSGRDLGPDELLVAEPACRRSAVSREIVEWFLDLGSARDACAIEVDCSEESKELLDVGRSRDLGDRLDLRRQRGDTVGRDSKSEEVDLSTNKVALGSVDCDAVRVQSSEQDVEVAKVLVVVCARHQDVVDVDVHEGKSAHDFVHEALESLCGVPEAEGHGQEREAAEGCRDGRLVDVFGGNRNLVVRSDEVDGAEDLGACDRLVEVEQIGDRVAVGQCDGIERSVVATRPPLPVLLGDDRDGRRPSGVGSNADALAYHVLEVSFDRA